MERLSPFIPKSIVEIEPFFILGSLSTNVSHQNGLSFLLMQRYQSDHDTLSREIKHETSEAFQFKNRPGKLHFNRITVFVFDLEFMYESL